MRGIPVPLFCKEFCFLRSSSSSTIFLMISSHKGPSQPTARSGSCDDSDSWMIIDEIRDVSSLDGENGVQTRQRGCEALGFLTARMERVRAFDLKVARLPSQRRRPHLAKCRRLCNSDVAALAPLTRSVRLVVVLVETGRSTAILNPDNSSEPLAEGSRAP